MAEATREGLNAPASRAMRSSEVGSMAEAIREREPKPSFICRLCSPLWDVSLGSLQWAEHHILSLAPLFHAQYHMSCLRVGLTGGLVPGLSTSIYQSRAFRPV